MNSHRNQSYSLSTTTRTTVHTSSGVELIVSSKQILVYLPKNEIDCQFLRSFKYYRWDKNKFCWIIPNWENNLELIQSYFGNRITKLEMIESCTLKSDIAQPTFTSNQLLVINNAFRQLKVYFSYQKEIVHLIKNISQSEWRNEERCWVLPFSKIFLIELRKIANQSGLDFEYREEQRPEIGRAHV